MSASNKLDQYLASYRQRLERLTLLQGVAAIALVLLIFAVVGAYFAIESGFASSTIITFRIILVLALAAVGLRFLAQPLQRLKSGISSEVETRASASAAADGKADSELGFNGRIETYVQMKAENSPFLELLAEDTLAVSESYPVDTQIETRELSLAGLVCATAVVILVYLLIAGPGNLNYSLRNLFAGWAVDDLLPPQSIVVNPGDQSIRRGANLRITAEMEGFSPDDATIHVQSGDGDWQEVELVQGPGGFEFTFFSMQEPMAYYISTTGLRSPEYDIQVVDLPSIESLSLTYNYPDWTQRDTETFTQGDINALEDTRIELTVITSSPLAEGELVLNEATQGLSLNGNEATTEFTISTEGEYYLAAIVGGEQVRLSDDYFIRITEDGKPVIEFIRPGEDYNASSIEEVLARVEASDDYGLDNAQIKYSINGSDWQSVDLAATGRELNHDHIFMLEDMRTDVIREVTTNVGAFNVILSEETELLPADEPSELDADGNPIASEPVISQIPLQPGDLISYYAQASDRTQTVRTDMFFIQVQSYSRRYTQSQISGGGGGGGGDQQDEISQRQRQIIVSTWNLIREQEEGDTNSQVEINSTLLSELQLTLADQAQTLAQRTRARQLDRDVDIENFVENLERAIQSMYPSSEQLALIELEDALQPAQEALQYLLRAEAIFNDITVTQQEGGGGGGGGGASEDLAEMFELEMDLEKNQYETGNNASPQAQQQEEDDIMSQLDELAKRQEQLANNLRNQQQPSEAQKYQQELLRREVEELQEQLERMQEQSQSAQQQASNSQQPGQEGQQGQGQGQSQSEENSQQQDSEQQQELAQQSELQRRIDSALRAMEDTANAMNGDLTQDELQRAAEEAQRQLEGARDQVAQNQLANMQEAFTDISSQADQMLSDQQTMEQTLQDAVVKALEERENGDPNNRGMTLQEEWALAAEKQELATDLQNLRSQMLDATQRFDEQVPEAARELQEANNDLAENGLEQAISDSALYIDNGYGLFIAGNDSGITADLRDLAQSLARAQQLASSTDANGDSDLTRAQAQARELRAQLQQLAQGGQPGSDPQQSSGEGEGEAQEGQGQGQEGQQGQGQGQQGGQQAGGGAQGGFGQLTANNGAWNGEGNQQNGPVELPADFFDNVDNLTQAARGALDQLDLNTEELAEMYDLIRELEYSRVNRNDSILAGEFNSMLALIEQLEASLQIDTNANNPNNVRTAVAELIPEEYRESVAEYYRRLSSE